MFLEALYQVYQDSRRGEVAQIIKISAEASLTYAATSAAGLSARPKGCSATLEAAKAEFT